MGSFIGEPANLTWVQLQTMQANGMDIQCHTYDHPLWGTMTEEQVLAEYDDNDTLFVANSLPAANHTAYPYGGYNANIETWTAERRLTARTVNRGFVLPSNNKFDLYTYSMDMSTTEELKAAMDIALSNKWGMMLYGHGIDGAQTPRAKFNELIDYAQEIGMDIITISELDALMT